MMTDARKTLKKIGGGKNSPRRNSSRRQKPRKRKQHGTPKRKSREKQRWKQAAIATLIATALFFVAYHLVFKKQLFRFKESTTTQKSAATTGVYGIDISRYQGKIDWEKLKADNPQDTTIHFVYMKATEGKDLKDPRFSRNWKKTKEAGFSRGAYHYFTEGSTGAEQASMYIKSVTLESGDLAPMIDVEETPKNKKSFNTELKGLILALEGHYGIKPIIYSSPAFRKKYLDDEFYDRYPIWVAHYYVDKPDIEKWDIWQFTDKGNVPGIGHDVDMNLFNGNIKELERLKIK